MDEMIIFAFLEPAGSIMSDEARTAYSSGKFTGRVDILVL